MTRATRGKGLTNALTALHSFALHAITLIETAAGLTKTSTDSPAGHNRSMATTPKRALAPPMLAIRLPTSGMGALPHSYSGPSIPDCVGRFGF